MREIIFLNEADSGYVKQSLMANGYSLTKQGKFDPEMLVAKGTDSIKSALGLDIATWILLILTLPLGGLAALPTAIATSIRKNNNLERINSDHYKELKAYVENDKAVADILKKIKAELTDSRPDVKTLKDLNSALKVELRRAKKDYKNHLIREQIEYVLSFDILD